MERQEKVIVITGANNGIGLYLITSLLNKGYRVAGLDLSGENIIALLEEHPERLIYLRCDVTNDTDVSNAATIVIEKWGQIDILVNNAVICDFVPFAERSLELTRNEFEVNYFGYLRMIQAVLPTLPSPLIRRSRLQTRNVSRGTRKIFTNRRQMTTFRAKRAGDLQQMVISGVCVNIDRYE